MFEIDLWERRLLVFYLCIEWNATEKFYIFVLHRARKLKEILPSFTSFFVAQLSRDIYIEYFFLSCYIAALKMIDSFFSSFPHSFAHIFVIVCMQRIHFSYLTWYFSRWHFSMWVFILVDANVRVYVNNVHNVHNVEQYSLHLTLHTTLNKTYRSNCIYFLIKKSWSLSRLVFH